MGLLVCLVGPVWGQQFAGTSASNSSTDVQHNDDLFRSFKDEDYAPALFQNKWLGLLKSELQGYTKAQWQVGVLADGDFSRALTEKSVAPRTGQLGLNAIKSVVLYKLKNPRQLRKPTTLDSLFASHQTEARRYDKRRGDMSWENFREQLKGWKLRIVADSTRKLQVAQRVAALHKDSAEARGIGIYKLAKYQALEAPRRALLKEKAQQTQKAVDLSSVRYLKFAAALENDYRANGNFMHYSGISKEDWLVGRGFMTSADVAKLKRTVAAEAKVAAKSKRPLTPQEQHNKLRLEVMTLEFPELEAAFGSHYLDSIATAWPRVWRYHDRLLQDLKHANDAAVTGTVFLGAEYDEVEKLVRDEYDAELRVQRDTLTQIGQRLSNWREALDDGTLPFEKLRYLNRMELNVVVSLGNGVDSLRARASGGTAPVITNQELFGSNLLVPGSAVQPARSVSMNFVFNPFTPLRQRPDMFGFHGFLNYSTTRWALPGSLRNSTAADSTYQVGIFSLSAGVQYTVFEVPASLNAAGNREGNNVKISFQLDFVYRNIGGDLGRSRHEAARDVFLGTHRRDYLGFQPSFIASIDNFRVTVSYPIFAKGEIAGFSSGGYPVIGFGFSGDLQAGHSKPSGAKPWRRLFK